MNPLEQLPGEVDHLLQTLAGQELWGPITTYTPFILLIILLVLLVVFAAKRQLSEVPQNRFVGVVEFFVDFTTNDIGKGMLGSAAKQHLPFLLTLFIFLLMSNLVGIIPGSKSIGGTMSVTVALALISFVYFTYYGIKHQGLGKYILSYAPHGVMKPMAAFIWLLEIFSMFLRLLTLSVRLFANMFAGHILLGVIALLTSLFITPLIQAFSVEALGFAGISVLWLLLLTILYALEVFVAVVQAYVFTLLSSVYVMLATTEH